MNREPFASLRARNDPSAFWATFAGQPKLGSLNCQTSTTIRSGAGLVRQGVIFNLDYPVDAFDPPMFADRIAARHNVFPIGPHNLDDSLTDYSLQGSSHLDGLRHASHPDFGFFGGGGADIEGSSAAVDLGVQAWSESGIFGRGVLIDLWRHRERAGRSIDWTRPEAFDLAEITEAAAEQGVRIEPGDAVLLYTGWIDRFYFPHRPDLSAKLSCAGVAQSEEFLAWLWDTSVSLIAADNVAVEVLPAVRESPFRRQYRGGLMHPILIPLMGMAIGELWRLERLAQACADDGVYEFLLVSSPLNLPGGVGSPANAYAVR